jgi:sulfotransferase family protein
VTPREPLAQLAGGPIFIGGHLRSGTTWVYEILCAHEEVGGVFESWLFHPRVGIGGVWKATIEQISRAAARQPERYLEVRYEDLHADPLPTLRTLFGFCRIPHDDGTLSNIIKKTDMGSHTVRGEDAFRRRGNVGDWREEFGPLQALAFQRAAGDTLIAKGYEESPRWWLRRLPIVRHRRREGSAPR